MKKNNYCLTASDWILGIIELLINIGVSCFCEFVVLKGSGLIVGLCVTVLLFVEMIIINMVRANINQGLEPISKQIKDTLKIIEIDDIYKQVLNLPEEYKNYGDMFLSNFRENMNLLVHEGRTGQLDKIDYYTSLRSYLSKLKKGDSVWACSTFLDGEWDETDAEERLLMQELLSVDKRGIPTKRLYIIKDVTVFQVSKDNCRVLKNLLKYLDGSTYRNTESVAILQSDVDDILQPQQKRLINLGFCAFKYKEEGVNEILVRDSCLDMGDQTDIQGEIVFSPSLVQKTYEVFAHCCECSTPLKQFIFANTNEIGIAYLEANGIKNS